MSEVCVHCHRTFGTHDPERVRFREFAAHRGCIRNAVRAVRERTLAMMARLDRRHFFPWLHLGEIRRMRSEAEAHALLERFYLRLNEESVVYPELDRALVRLQEFSERMLLRELPSPEVFRRDIRRIRRRVRQAGVQLAALN